MKKLFCVLVLTLVLFACARAETEADLQARYEESVAFQTLNTICACGTDKIRTYQCTTTVKRDSNAYKALTSLDSGYFGKNLKIEYLDYRSENWEILSDTAFACDVYGTCRVMYSYNVTYDFPLAYHLCFEQANAANDTWLCTDMANLPVESDIETAARITAENEGLTLTAVTGKYCHGFLLTIDDPSRVFVGTIDKFSETTDGLRIDALTEKYGAVAGINGGCFSDPGGGGTGGKPVGYVKSQGKLLSNHAPKLSGCCVVTGLTEENQLVVGEFGYTEIETVGYRDALAFHHALIQNGEKVAITDREIYTTRTAMGQDAEGRILMLVLEGRQPGSLGASFLDEQEILYSFGAVEAGNLDGGSSSCLYVAGESIMSGYYQDVSRKLPAGFLVSAIE